MTPEKELSLLGRYMRLFIETIAEAKKGSHYKSLLPTFADYQKGPITRLEQEVIARYKGRPEYLKNNLKMLVKGVNC